MEGKFGVYVGLGLWRQSTRRDHRGAYQLLANLISSKRRLPDNLKAPADSCTLNSPNERGEMPAGVELGRPIIRAHLPQ